MRILCLCRQTVSLGRSGCNPLAPGNLDLRHAAQGTLMRAGRNARVVGRTRGWSLQMRLCAFTSLGPSPCPRKEDADRHTRGFWELEASEASAQCPQAAGGAVPHSSVQPPATRRCGAGPLPAHARQMPQACGSRTDSSGPCLPLRPHFLPVHSSLLYPAAPSPGPVSRAVSVSTAVGSGP